VKENIISNEFKSKENFNKKKKIPFFKEKREIHK